MLSDTARLLPATPITDKCTLQAGDGGQWQALELPLPARGEPALSRGRLEVAPCPHGNLAVAELAAEPDQLHAMADELAGLAQGGGWDPDRREEVTTEQERQARCASTRSFLRRAAAIAFVCFGCERNG
jgi:hypothetical protein